MNVTKENLERIFDEVIILNDLSIVSGRFTHAKARRRDKWFFIKIANGNEYRVNLKNESLWSEFMNRADVMAPGMKLKGPQIVQQIGEDALVFEYIDAPMVAERGDASAWRTHLQRYTDTLVKLDKLCGDFSLSHIYTKLHHPYELDDASWREWVGGSVDPEIVAQAKKVFTKYEWNVSLRLQHNDMSPWQIFEQGEAWIIFDGERANLQSPRFNDVAGSYVRMHNTVHDPALASEFLNKFITGIEITPEDFYPQFIPVLTMRAVGSLADATSDPGRYDYRNEAEILVQKCLSGKLDVLLQK